jgi:hypothetical protein
MRLKCIWILIVALLHRYEYWIRYDWYWYKRYKYYKVQNDENKIIKNKIIKIKG